MSVAKLLIGKNPVGPVELDAPVLLRHMACLGSSGSGKTVACKVVVEEAVRAGIPVIAIDPQGDIASFLCPPERKQAEARGVPPALARDVAERIDPVVWTPGSSVGIPLRLDPLRPPPPHAKPEEEIRDRSLLAASVAGLAGYDLDSDDGRSASACLDLILQSLHARGAVPGRMAELAVHLDDPDGDLRSQLHSVASASLPAELARRLRVLDVGASSLLFSLGRRLDIDDLLGLNAGQPAGRTRVSVIYLNSLPSQEDKEFFLSVLTQELYRWMLSHPSKELQALFYIDEIAPFLPPVRKPACKDALKLLFKQARKYGLGCLIATQNPGDVDYNSLSQFSTWNLGRLLTKQDVKKVEGVIKSLDPVGAAAVVRDLPSLEAGEFRLLSPDQFDAPVAYKTRWLVSAHTTLDEEAISALTDKRKLRDRFPYDPSPVLPQGTTVEAAPVDDAEKLINALTKARRTQRVSQIAGALGISDAKITGLVKQLESDGRVKRAKIGGTWQVWSAEYDLRPDLGLDQVVEVARLEIREAAARKRAQSSAHHSFFGLRAEETVDAFKLRHHPLWQIHVTADKTSGFWLWSETVAAGEKIYIDPYSGDLWGWGRKEGFYRVPASDESALEFQDLDDICTFDEVGPGELNLHPGALDHMMVAERAAALAQQKFDCEVVRTALVFLPYWVGALKHKATGERRFVHLDAVVGLPVSLPDRTRPSSEIKSPSGKTPAAKKAAPKSASKAARKSAKKPAAKKPSGKKPKQ